ncbi:ribosomal protein S18-alanine N-acetyltransferase [Pleomorphomonas sp. PLEO]|uniref:ribosomal protein S18-alanine N-acetyltransferase n=1 Tax=Pleomorphomonas sp. PLEO TaxID=3239306 RepID=UPI00351E9E71
MKLCDLTRLFAPPRPVCEPGRIADADDLAALHARAFRHGWPATEMEAMIADPTVTTIVAREGRTPFTRRPVGFVMVRAAADEAEILTVAVAPTRRGRGIGRLLMDETIRRLYFMRVASLFLEVDEGNGPALALYRHLGFREVGHRANYYAGGTANALVMRADLK